jgi:predicted AAA+ superfamily ATPase
MYARLATTRLRQFPAVLILGARQVGKTTLAQLTFPDLPYCDLCNTTSTRRKFGWSNCE